MIFFKKKTQMAEAQHVLDMIASPYVNSLTPLQSHVFHQIIHLAEIQSKALIFTFL